MEGVSRWRVWLGGGCGWNSLSAVFIHALGDMITPPNTVYLLECLDNRS